MCEVYLQDWLFILKIILLAKTSPYFFVITALSFYIHMAGYRDHN